MFTSPKTTILGLLAGIAMIWGSMINNRINNPQAPPVTIGTVLAGALMAATGAASKDHNT